MPKKNRKQRPQSRTSRELELAKRAAKALATGDAAKAAQWAATVEWQQAEPDVIWIAAKIKLSTGDLLGARPLLQTLREEFGDDREVAFLLACCNANLGNISEALAVLADFEFDVDRYVMLAREILASGDNVAAVSLLEDAEQRFPFSAEPRIERASMLWDSGQPEAARGLVAQVWDSGKAMLDVDARGWFNLGVLCEVMDADAVRPAADRTPVQTPDHTFGQSDGDSRAQRAYQAAMAVDANYAPAWTNQVVLLLKQQRLSEAIELSSEALATHADHEQLRYLRAFAQRLIGQVSEAIGDLRQLVDRTDRVDVWELLARCLVEAEEPEAATQHLRRWLAAFPKNPVALHLLSAVTGDGIPARASEEFVVETFDTFAETFDATLGKLEYRGPEFFRQMLEEHLGEPEGSLVVLDAGCGTGLIGPVVKPYAHELVGVDLSSAMLRQAGGKGCYDRLECVDLVQHLEASPGKYQLIVAADTFNYFGDLKPLIAKCFSALQAHGWLAFSVEEGPLAEDQYFLQSHGRYVHSPAYLIERLGEAGVAGGDMSRVVLRKEGEQSVYALLIAVQKPTSEAD